MATPNKKKQSVPVKLGFDSDCIRVLISNLIPLKKLRPEVKSSRKYQQILASVRSVGLVEPPAVIAIPGNPSQFYLLDGHLRIEALKDLDITEVECLVAAEDDTYTYNKRINKLSAVQDHRMIARAVDRGVPMDRIAEALGVTETTIQYRFRLLNGICQDVIALLGDKPCPAKVFKILREMKPLRQIEAAELMLGQNTYSVSFATAILSATSPSMLDSKMKASTLVSPDSMARMERELAALQAQNKLTEDHYGPDVLHLTVIKGYLGKLLSSAAIVKWLATNQPDYLKEFQNITDVMELPGHTTIKANALQEA